MEYDNNHQSSRGRETMLTIILALLGGGGFLLFLILVSGGFFFYVGVAFAGIAAFGAVHYVLWGHAMTQEVAQEQAEEAAIKETEQAASSPHRRWKRQRRF
jgi:hypothetical protein